jgi:hypothetical protein
MTSLALPFVDYTCLLTLRGTARKDDKEMGENEVAVAIKDASRRRMLMI